MTKRDIGQLPAQIGQREQIVQDRHKIVILKHRLLDILIYSTVEYTIEYMYKFIALRSEFCTLNHVIFESGQNHVVG